MSREAFRTYKAACIIALPGIEPRRLLEQAHNMALDCVRDENKAFQATDELHAIAHQQARALEAKDAELEQLRAELEGSRAETQVIADIARERAETILAYEKDALATLRAQHATRHTNMRPAELGKLTNQEAASFLSASCGDDSRHACSVIHSLGDRFAALEAQLAQATDARTQAQHQVSIARALLDRSVLRGPLDELVQLLIGQGRGIAAGQLEDALKRADNPLEPMKG